MSPILRCRIQNSTPKPTERVDARACFDTGAQISTIPRSLLNQVPNWQRTKGPRDVTFIAANGTPMGAGDFAKFRLVIKASGNTITMDPVLITDDDGIDGLTILIGTPDLKRNQINVDIVTDEIVFPNNFRLPFDSCVPHTQTGRMSVVQKKTKTETNQRSARESATTIPPQETKQRPRNLACPTAPSSYAKAVKSDLQPKVDHFQIDARDKYRRRMENLNAEKQNTCTIEQVNWDPDLLKNDPEPKKELKAIMWEYRRVFSDTKGREPVLSSVPEMELSEIKDSLSPDPVTSSPVHTLARPAEWKNASTASTIPPLEAKELSKALQWSQIQEETQVNLQVTPTSAPTDYDPQIDVLKGPETVVTMTPGALKRSGLIPPERSQPAQKARPKPPWGLANNPPSDFSNSPLNGHPKGPTRRSLNSRTAISRTARPMVCAGPCKRIWLLQLQKLADGLILLPSGYQSPKMDFSYLRPATKACRWTYPTYVRQPKPGDGLFLPASRSYRMILSDKKTSIVQHFYNRYKA